jgi:hypothetical protein
MATRRPRCLPFALPPRFIAGSWKSCYATGMTTREKVIQAIQDLPDDASVEDAMERLLLLAKIERGIQQADSGQTIAHAQVKERMAKWLK